MASPTLTTCVAFLAIATCSTDVTRSRKIPETWRMTVANAYAAYDEFCRVRLDGDYQNPDNPCGREFFKCSNGETSVFECQQGLVFNPRTDECDYKTNVPGCGGEEYTTTGPPQPTESSPPPTASEEPGTSPPTTAQITSTRPLTTAMKTTRPPTTAVKTTRRPTTVTTKSPFGCDGYAYRCVTDNQCPGSLHSCLVQPLNVCNCWQPGIACSSSYDCCNYMCINGKCANSGGNKGATCTTDGRPFHCAAGLTCVECPRGNAIHLGYCA